MSNPEFGSSPENEPTDLTVCDNCEQDLVYPTEWVRLSTEYHVVNLRCPGCEHCTVGIADDATVEQLDYKLDESSQIIADNLAIMEAASSQDAKDMEKYVEMFARALQNNHILPEDF